MSTQPPRPAKPAGKPPISFGQLVAVLAGVLVVILLVRMAFGGGSPTSAPTPSPTVITSPSPGGSGLPACAMESKSAVLDGYDDWARTLVDPIYALPSDYVPPDLVPITQAGFVGDLQIRREVIPDLTKLRKAAERNGTPLGIVAAYRSYADQQELFDTRVDLIGKQDTLDRTARPGHSEHQLGTAIDFRDADAEDVTPSWGKSPAGMWMAEHAWEYGFVLSYPRGQTDIVCYDYEPWHYRYVGNDAANEMRVSGDTLREYLWNEQ